MTPLLVASAISLPGRLIETSITLQAGELTCLIGPNGSGKTSLLHSIAGIGAPDGRVAINGVDVRAAGPHQRRRLFSYLPASRDIAWPLAAADLVRLGAPDGKDAKVEGILADLGLAGMADRRIDQMSTGERSRVLVVRALVAKPRLLLLDEPVANLDPLWQLRLMDYLRESARQNDQAMLIAMHDLELARRYADRLIIMDGGRVAADGPPASLLDGPIIPAIFGIERRPEGWRPTARI